LREKYISCSRGGVLAIKGKSVKGKPVGKKKIGGEEKGKSLRFWGGNRIAEDKKEGTKRVHHNKKRAKNSSAIKKGVGGGFFVAGKKSGGRYHREEWGADHKTPYWRGKSRKRTIFSTKKGWS